VYSGLLLCCLTLALACFLVVRQLLPPELLIWCLPPALVLLMANAGSRRLVRLLEYGEAARATITGVQRIQGKSLGPVESPAALADALAAQHHAGRRLFDAHPRLRNAVRRLGQVGIGYALLALGGVVLIAGLTSIWLNGGPLKLREVAQPVDPLLASIVFVFFMVVWFAVVLFMRAIGRHIQRLASGADVDLASIRVICHLRFSARSGEVVDMQTPEMPFGANLLQPTVAILYDPQQPRNAMLVEMLWQMRDARKKKWICTKFVDLG
jgi:hypothetical protein